jgi:alpha,alpha-trehalose phosphorylase
MLKRKPLNPPKEIYPVDPWRIVETRYYPCFTAQTETMFSVSNGYLGMRGCCEEGAPVFENGTFINGYYETWPICYGEEAHGFATEGQTIVNVPDSKIFHLFVDGEPFTLLEANLADFERVLDMRAGTMNREILWDSPSGKRVRIKSRRLVSYEQRHLAAICYEVTVDADADVVITSLIRNKHEERLKEDDPRLNTGLKGKVLLPKINFCRDQRVVLAHVTERSKLHLVSGIDHVVETDCKYDAQCESSADEGKVVFSCAARAEKPIRVTKFMVYHTLQSLPLEELSAGVERILDRAKRQGFDGLLESQREKLQDFWERSDVRLEGEGGTEHRIGELQQALRYNLFQIFQASVRLENTSIPAKGLTGQAYDGNYFWDTEIYVLPFLLYTYPHLARELLLFRYRLLDKARKRAAEVSEKGALFPWRTINGAEASAYYAAGTAQYHINGDIMYALQQYAEVTEDDEFLFTYGAEMLVETARMWYGLGFFSERRGGSFCIHAVTGPDEYTTVVDNNLYTNLIARNNLSYAADTLRRMREKQPESYETIVETTQLQDDEIDNWRQAAARMYLPFDEKLQIHPQDDSFLDKEVWDFEHTSMDDYPLLLHYHPLKIYRHQVIKQADVALAMFLMGNKFSPEQKRRNFDYYDPLTTGDSSLSVCIESIMALEVGYLDKAIEYAYYAVLMDLEDMGGNVKDGCHLASMGGCWMLCVYGFAGMRDYGGALSFRPRLPPGLKRLAFPLCRRGQVLDIAIEPETSTYRLRTGKELAIRHWGREVTLSEGEVQSFKNESV